MPEGNTAPAAPAPGTPEYNAAMIAKARGESSPAGGAAGTTPPGDAPAPTPPAGAQKPEGIPDKFWDAEKGQVRVAEMAKSYTELERARSQQPPPSGNITPPADAGAPIPSVTPPVQPQQTPPADPVAAVNAARAKATEELAKDGKLSDATYAELNKLGFDRNAVDTYVAGQRAQINAYVNSMHTVAGGKDKFDAAIEWARTAFTPEEATAFDGALRSGQDGAMRIAVQGLMARHAATLGHQGNRLQPGPADSQSNVAGFKSREEMVAAMRDARYQRGDSAYHAEVQAKIAASRRAGVDLGINIIQSGNIT